jgi:hypothetical protein
LGAPKRRSGAREALNPSRPPVMGRKAVFGGGKGSTAGSGSVTGRRSSAATRTKTVSLGIACCAQRPTLGCRPMAKPTRSSRVSLRRHLQPTRLASPCPCEPCAPSATSASLAYAVGMNWGVVDEAKVRQSEREFNRRAGSGTSAASVRSAGRGCGFQAAALWPDPAQSSSTHTGAWSLGRSFLRGSLSMAQAFTASCSARLTKM